MGYPQRGERTWARIVTHLIVMGTTTSLPFAWFDEPLEHLDPQLRHAVAATLATATRGGSPRQLLVITYEHGIAQQLADDTDGASIIAIRDLVPPIAEVVTVGSPVARFRGDFGGQKLRDNHRSRTRCCT